MRRLLAPVLIALALLSGCAANPVTGKRELQLVSQGEEIALGQQNYVPSRQMQGGDYSLDPGLTAYVRDVGQRLAAVSDRPELPYDFVVLNNSVPNAWALPGGKIAVNRGLLLELGSEAELAAVLGHEIVHAAARHGAKSMERGMLLQAALLAVQLSTMDNRYANYIVGSAQIGAMLISQTYGRGAELESDAYGMRYMATAGYDPNAAIDLQETFLRLSEGGNDNWLTGLFASHPPSAQRVEQNRLTAAELGVQGDYGRERYAEATAALQRSAPAYESYDKAIEAARNGDSAAARRLVDEALQMEPREARFHALLGDLAAERNRYREAIRHYDTALRLDEYFFQTYLRRGLLRENLGNLKAAEADLNRSIRLLPTATAHYSLGTLAQRDGRLDEAKRHFGTAANSDSDVGQKATMALVRLDLPSNPSAYVKTQLRVDERGYVSVAVQNAAPLAVRNVSLVVGVLDASLRQVQQTFPFDIRQAIQAGQGVILPTGIGPVDAAQLQRVRVQIRGASVAE